MENGLPRPATLAWTLVGAALLALIALIALSPARPIYDEAWFLDTMRLIERDGLSVKFLREFPGAAGPTFTLVFAAVDSLVGLAFPWLRLVNVALLTGTAALIWRGLVVAQPDAPNPALTAAMLIVLPTAGVSAGLALTEVPAAIFAMLAIVMLVEAHAARAPLAMACAALGGVALAAAILGRQNYLLVLPCLVLAVRWIGGRPNLNDTWHAALLAAVAIVIVAPVFVLWGGLVPPRTAWSTAGFAPDNVVRGAGYAGVILLLLAPRIYAPLRQRIWLATIVLATIPIAYMLGGSFVPLRAIMMTLFGGRGLTFIGWAAACLVSFAAPAFLLCFTLHLWRHRDQWLTRLSGAFVLLGLLSNAKITHQFSSRYVFIVLPFMVIAAAAIRVTRWTPLQMTSAAGISLAALASYYFTR